MGADHQGEAALRRKYTEEVHANEVAILPYYIANLNIEATYAAVTGQFAEYPNLCFVDTLDNTEGLGIRRGQQMSFLGEFTGENTAWVRRQKHRVRTSFSACQGLHWEQQENTQRTLQGGSTT